MSEELNGIVISHKPISEASLKRLILIFDQLHFIAPIENKFLIPEKTARYKIDRNEFILADYGLLYNGENFMFQENQLLDKFNYPIDKGIIRIIDLKIRKFYEKNWLPLRLAYDFDLGNADLLNNYIPLIEKEKEITVGNGIIRGGFTNPSGIKLYPDLPPIVSFFDEAENKLYNSDLQISSIAARMDRFLAVSQEFNLIPIFINEYLAKAFTMKAEIAKQNQEKKLKTTFSKIHHCPLESVQYLLHKISEIILPDAILNEISIKELVYARNNTYEESMKLRRKLTKSLNFLIETEFDDAFLEDVNEYIIHEIEPAIGLYQNKFLDTLGRFLKYSFTFGATIAGSIIGIQQSLSPTAIAYLSALSGTIGSVTSDLSSYLIKRPKSKFENTFSYFINLRE